MARRRAQRAVVGQHELFVETACLAATGVGDGGDEIWLPVRDSSAGAAIDLVRLTAWRTSRGGEEAAFSLNRSDAVVFRFTRCLAGNIWPSPSDAVAVTGSAKCLLACSKCRTIAQRWTVQPTLVQVAAGEGPSLSVLKCRSGHVKPSGQRGWLRCAQGPPMTIT